MSTLYQPILTIQPEYGHDPNDVLSLSDFLQLIREEENYFIGEEFNTRLTITRLRKIFYDKWGWDTHLINKAAKIKGRYDVQIIDCPAINNNIFSELKKIKNYDDNVYKPKCRFVTYRKDDRIYGDTRVGQVPYIYKSDHQDVFLPEGYYCDIAHVFAGLDAMNNRQSVGPISDCPDDLKKYFPNADSNVDVVTWLGDIATISSDFLLEYLRTNNSPLDETKEQFYINVNASGSDILGDIDSYVIYTKYKVDVTKGIKVSEILDNYYSENFQTIGSMKNRINIFCSSIGLKDWNGSLFSNETEWLRYYEGQLRNTICFMLYSIVSEPVRKILLPIQVQDRRYEDVIKPQILLNLFLTAIKKLM